MSGKLAQIFFVDLLFPVGDRHLGKYPTLFLWKSAILSSAMPCAIGPGSVRLMRAACVHEEKGPLRVIESRPAAVRSSCIMH